LRYQAPQDFQVNAANAQKIRVIEIIPEQIVTKAISIKPRIVEGKIVSDVEQDVLKLVVIERHRATGNVGVGFVRGFELKRGAFASTVAHDAHNLIAVGVTDDDIAAAVKALEGMCGGQVAVRDGKVLAALPLPIAGLVSDKPLQEVTAAIEALNAQAAELGCKLAAPFMSLSFLSLSPIPALRLTDQGLVDAVSLKLTTLIES